MTKDEMIKFYANKIVEDGIKDCTEFSNVIDLNYYKDVSNYKQAILQKIYIDERVADVNLDGEGNLDMVFYTDFCLYYYEDEENQPYYTNVVDTNLQKAKLLEDFADYYSYQHLLGDSYISTRRLINEFVDTKKEFQHHKYEISNFLKKSIIKTRFIDKYIENTEVFVTPFNYKEFERDLHNIANQLSKLEQENIEEFE